jgi:RHS repeat-associated protein
MKAITTFLFVLNMMLTLNSIGGDITYVTSRGGINTGDTNSLQLPQSSSGSVNYISIDNRIVFSVNHDHDSINEVVDKVEVELHVEMKSIGGTRITDTIILELNNLVSGVHSRDIHIKTFQDQVEISYRVISSSASDKTGNTVALSPMQELFQLYMETTVRQVSLLSTAPINGSASLLVCDSLHHAAKILWNFIPGAEEYDLEYFFVNSIGKSDTTNPTGAIVFKNNSTRISTNKNHYIIPLIGHLGHLFFRLRAVGRSTVNPEKHIYSSWTQSDDTLHLSNLIPGKDYVRISNNFQRALNWNNVTTFAENGKKKEVIEYYDGLLKNRQSTALLNTDSTSLTSETVYDYSGRPAVTALPFPHKECASKYPSLAYVAETNLDSLENVFDYTHFDLDADTNDCSVASAPMSSLSGSSKYYSPNNPNQNGHHRYIPDAQGFPYSQTEYMPDNTGRIRSQGNVGKDFQLGSGHETMYMYSKPFQSELDHFFGSNIGLASHYTKTAVQDPNGQISIQYTNAQGKTVATALDGESPANMNDISSYNGNIDTLTVDLFEKDINGISTCNSVSYNDNLIEFAQEISITKNKSIHFDYGISFEHYDDSCLKDTVCLQCVYDLEFYVIDDCGSIVHATTGHLGKFEHDSSGIVAVTSDTAKTDTSFSVSLNLEKGVYSVVKKLKLNDKILNQYVDDYIQGVISDSSCIAFIDDFIAADSAGMDFYDCNLTCESCKDHLGTKQDFIANGLGTGHEYDLLKMACDDLCNQMNFCSRIYGQMLEDVSPGGQYGYIEGRGPNLGLNSKIVSLFNDPGFKISMAGQQYSYPSILRYWTIAAGRVPLGNQNLSPNWRNPVRDVNDILSYEYYDRYGNIAYLEVLKISGNYYPEPIDNSYIVQKNGSYFIKPQHLKNLEDFLRFWRPSFARSLVKYHPEISYYEDCIKLNQEITPNPPISHQPKTFTGFDQTLDNAITWDEAISLNLLDTNNLNNTVHNWLRGNGSAQLYDPIGKHGHLFNTTQFDAPDWRYFIDSIDLKFSNYIDFGSNSISLYELIGITVRAPHLSGNQIRNLFLPTKNIPPNLQFGSQFYPNPSNSAQIRYNKELLNKEWGLLKALYKNYKHKYIADILHLLAIKKHGYNACIGNANFDYYAYGFHDNTNSSPFYDYTQTCGYLTYKFFSNKVARFQSDIHVPEKGGINANYEYFLQTGQCPVDVRLEKVLDEIARNSYLDSLDGVDVYQHVLNFGGLFNEINNKQNNLTVPGCTGWQPSNYISNNKLKLELKLSNNQTYIVELFDPAYAGQRIWGSIEGFDFLLSDDQSAISFTPSTNLPHAFKVRAHCYDASGKVSYKELEGATNIELGACTFGSVCTPNDIGRNVERIFSRIATQFGADSNVSQIDNITPNLFSIPLLNTLNKTAGHIGWDYNPSSETFCITSNGSDLCLKINSSSPVQFNRYDSIAYIKNLNSEFENYFVFDAYDTAGVFLATLRGSAYTQDNSGTITPLNLGTCGLPKPLQCSGDPFTLAENLEEVLRERLTTQNYDILKSPAITNTLINYFSPLSSSANHKFENGNRKLIFYSDTLDSLCSITLKLVDPTTTHNLNQVIDIEDFKVIDTSGFGPFFNFEFDAIFDSAGNPVESLVQGSSCLPLKNCVFCDPVPNGTAYSPELLHQYRLNEINQQLKAFTRQFARVESTVVEIPESPYPSIPPLNSQLTEKEYASLNDDLLFANASRNFAQVNVNDTDSVQIEVNDKQLELNRERENQAFSIPSRNTTPSSCDCDEINIECRYALEIDGSPTNTNNGFWNGNTHWLYLNQGCPNPNSTEFYYISTLKKNLRIEFKNSGLHTSGGFISVRVFSACNSSMPIGTFLPMNVSANHQVAFVDLTSTNHPGPYYIVVQLNTCTGMLSLEHSDCDSLNVSQFHTIRTLQQQINGINALTGRKQVPIVTWPEFLEYQCECASDYITHLVSRHYVLSSQYSNNPSSVSLSETKSMKHFCNYRSCEEARRDLDSRFHQYHNTPPNAQLAITTQSGVRLYSTGTWHQVLNNNIADSVEFDLCKCNIEYEQYISGIIDGTIPNNGRSFLSVDEFCREEEPCQDLEQTYFNLVDIHDYVSPNGFLISECVPEDLYAYCECMPDFEDFVYQILLGNIEIQDPSELCISEFCGPNIDCRHKYSEYRSKVLQLRTWLNYHPSVPNGYQGQLCILSAEEYSEACHCSKNYLAMIDSILISGVSHLPPDPTYLCISNFCAGPPGGCLSTYDAYTNKVDSLNTWIDTSNTGFNTVSHAPAAYFDSTRCFCYDDYASFIDSVMSGSYAILPQDSQLLDISSYCGSGIGIGCINQYPGYLDRVNSFNANYLNPSGDTLFPAGPNEFLQYCDCVNPYKRYLKIVENYTYLVPSGNHSFDIANFCSDSCGQKYFNYVVTVKDLNVRLSNSGNNTVQPLNVDTFKLYCDCYPSYDSLIDLVTSNRTATIFPDSLLHLDSFCVSTPGGCVDKYVEYQYFMSDINSVLRNLNGKNPKVLPVVYPVLPHVFDSSICSCFDGYKNYWNILTGGANNTTKSDYIIDNSDIINILDFCDECNDSYTAYVQAVNTYNSWQIHNRSYPAALLRPNSAIPKPNVCNCIQEYVLYLTEIMQGKYTAHEILSAYSGYGYRTLDIMNFCSGGRVPYDRDGLCDNLKALYQQRADDYHNWFGANLSTLAANSVDTSGFSDCQTRIDCECIPRYLAFTELVMMGAIPHPPAYICAYTFCDDEWYDTYFDNGCGLIRDIYSLSVKNYEDFQDTNRAYPSIPPFCPSIPSSPNTEDCRCLVEHKSFLDVLTTGVIGPKEVQDSLLCADFYCAQDSINTDYDHSGCPNFSYQSYVGFINDTYLPFQGLHPSFPVSNCLLDTADYELHCHCVGDWMVHMYDIMADTSNGASYGVEDVCLQYYCGSSADSTSCSAKYICYSQTVDSFNVLASDPANGLPSAPLLSYAEFTADYCDCVDPYLAYLNTILDGYLGYGLVDTVKLDIASHCTEPPCIKKIFPLEPLDSLILDDSLRCARERAALIYQNAQIAFDAYVRDLRTEIANKYRTHCLVDHPTEELHMRYVKYEHHYTLYYYDQAGNLVRTVPPEGVEYVDVSDPAQDHQLKQDRASNLVSLEPEHRMATTYMYNSHNQIIRQTIPDHDTVIRTQLSSAQLYPLDFIPEEVEFTNNGIGYIGGKIDDGFNNPYGAIYKTTDAGSNWSPMGPFNSETLNDVQVDPASGIGYAVGDNGLVLKTEDHGSHWKTIQLNTAGLNGDLTCVEIRTGRTDTTVLIAGRKGLISFYDGSNWNQDSSHTNIDFTGIAYQNGEYWLTGHDRRFIPAGGVVLHGNGTGSWTELDNIKPAEIHALSKTDNTLWAAGPHGFLMRRNIGSSSSSWKKVNTHSAFDFKKLHFLDDSNAIAVAEQDGFHQLIETFDAGATWRVIHTDSNEFRDWEIYKQEFDPNGQVNLAKILLFNSPKPNKIGYVLKPLNASGLYREVDLSALTDTIPRRLASAKEDDMGALFIAVNSDTGFAVCPNGYSGINTWYDIPIQTSLQHMTDLQIDTAHFNQTAGSKVLVLDGSNMERITFDHSFANIQWSSKTFYSQKFSSLGGGEIYTYSPGSTKVYDTDNTSVQLATIPLNTYDLVPDPSGNLWSVSYGPLDQYDQIDIRKTSTTSASYTSYNLDFRLPPINDIDSIPGSNLVAVGDDGIVLCIKNTTNSDTGVVIQAPTPNNLNAVNHAILLYTTGLKIVGDSGTYLTLKEVTLDPQFYPVSINTQENLTDIASAYSTSIISGQNGSMLKVNLFGSIHNLSNPTGQPMNAITYGYSGQQITSVGSSGTVLYGYHSNLQEHQRVYMPPMTDMDFFDEHHGMAVFEDFLIRGTHDGGHSWFSVHPIDTFHHAKFAVTLQSPDSGWVFANRVGTISDKGYKIKNGRLLAPQNFNNLNPSDAVFATPLFGAVSSNTGKTYYTKDGGLNWQHVNNTTLNALESISDSCIIAAGDAGHVDRILVQSSGTVARTIFSNVNVSGNLLDITTIAEQLVVVDTQGIFISEPYDWKNKNKSDSIIFYPLLQTALTRQYPNRQLSCVDMADDENGVIGGGNGPMGMVNRFHRDKGRYNTFFYYDVLGRLLVSQNSKQYMASEYAYTLYDELGRVSESGVKTENTNDMLFDELLGTDLNGNFLPDRLDYDRFEQWISGDGHRKEVVKTTYTTAFSDPTKFTSTQENLRNRVSAIRYFDSDYTDATPENNYDHTTIYSYDVHGNVKTLWQYNPTADLPGYQSLKRMDYDYDLISGNVKGFHYQKDMPDEWNHRYRYDADNRLIEVETSPDGVIWDLDVKYHYYPHGPLTRVELGEHNVQGIDYAYTLQGWIKGVNSESGAHDWDMGRDGNIVGGPNDHFGRDAFGYVLQYYQSDYKAIGSSDSTVAGFLAHRSGSALEAHTKNLYNGNISSMTTTIAGQQQNAQNDLGLQTQAMAYEYDQLNRLTQAAAFDQFADNAWQATNSIPNKYRNEFSYDANGNIATQSRYNGQGNLIDSLVYFYESENGKKTNNRLYHYHDLSSDTTALELEQTNIPFDSAAPNSVLSSNFFRYDELGNLVADLSNDIHRIDWRADGKVRSVHKTDSSHLSFDYDGLGNRIAKHQHRYDTLIKSTYYSRDAQGNVMAIYEKTLDHNNSTLSHQIKERYIYGSNRVGTFIEEAEMIGSSTTNTTFSHHLGARNYELVNHLGNVLAVVSDAPIKVDTNNDHLRDYNLPTLLSSQDYYPFGSLMRERSFGGYRYGFNGMEKDDEVKGSGNSLDFGARILDPRLGRFLSIDPAYAKFPYHSVYIVSDNSPIQKIDYNGLWGIEVHLPNNRSNDGILILKNDQGVIQGIWRAAGRGVAQGTWAERRMAHNGDTPLGTWDISHWQQYRSSSEKKSYGIYRLWLTNFSGESVNSDKDVNTIRVHAALRDGRTGKNGERTDGKLWNTHGCIRLSLREVTQLYFMSKELELGSNESPTTLTVSNDFGTSNSLNESKEIIGVLRRQLFDTYRYQGTLLEEQQNNNSDALNEKIQQSANDIEFYISTIRSYTNGLNELNSNDIDPMNSSNQVETEINF